MRDNFNVFLIGWMLRKDPTGRKPKPSPEFTIRDKIALTLFIAIFGVLALFFLTYVIVNLFL